MRSHSSTWAGHILTQVMTVQYNILRYSDIELVYTCIFVILITNLDTWMQCISEWDTEKTLCFTFIHNFHPYLPILLGVLLLPLHDFPLCTTPLLSTVWGTATRESSMSVTFDWNNMMIFTLQSFKRGTDWNGQIVSDRQLVQICVYSLLSLDTPLSVGAQWLRSLV